MFSMCWPCVDQCCLPQLQLNYLYSTYSLTHNVNLEVYYRLYCKVQNPCFVWTCFSFLPVMIIKLKYLRCTKSHNFFMVRYGYTQVITHISTHWKTKSHNRWKRYRFHHFLATLKNRLKIGQKPKMTKMSKIVISSIYEIW